VQQLAGFCLTHRVASAVAELLVLQTGAMLQPGSRFAPSNSSEGWRFALAINMFRTSQSPYSVTRGNLVVAYIDINTKNCSLSIVLTATDQKPQKSLKR